MEAVKQTPRLSEVLFEAPCRNFGSLAALPSNVQSIEAGLLFATGIQPFVAIVGPSGWGKSHLLEAASHRVGQDSCLPPEIRSATDWANSSKKVDLQTVLLLDNVQDALESSRVRQLLQVALERRVKAGKPTMLAFTAPKPTRQIKGFLPNAREWMVSTMTAPDPSERLVVLEHMCAAEGLVLSSELGSLLAYRLKGNGRTLVGALKRLKLYGGQWASQGQMLRACGLLEPFFADNSAWDIRERIQWAVDRAQRPSNHISPSDMVAYLMVCEASLSEVGVARFLGVEPGEVYQKAAFVQESRLKSEAIGKEIQSCIDRFIECLTAE